MPLPDERPRQSVANLIGRFEQQGKRQASPVVPVIPRSSSVSSQIAGDAAKEEVREKREWPPKPLPSAGIQPVTLSLSDFPRPSGSAIVSAPPPVPDPQVDSPTTPTPASPEQVKPPPSKGKVVSPGKSTATKGTWRAAASSAKSRSPAANISSAKSSVNTHPPRTSLPSSVSQPLKPQHTGQSVLSNPSTARDARVVPKTAPSTPSRPKSSASQSPAAARPKTPSSGLFAPTAASLARSRNVPPPPPPPVKKVTLSSDAAERLSKPTAASLSKARALVPSAPSPARTTKATSRGSSKSKVTRASVKPNETTGIKEEDVPVPTSEPSCDSEHLVTDHVENGHEPGTGARLGSPEDIQDHSEVVGDVVVGDATHDPIADEDGHSDLGIHPEQQDGEHPVEEEARSHEHVSEDLPEEEPAQVHEDAHLEVHEDPVPESTEPLADEMINDESPKVEHTIQGNEIEDLVHLLEGTPPPKSRPQSIVSIPDEDGEIPDEY